MLHERAPTCCKFHRKWEVRTQKCCKYPWNSSFQLQNVIQIPPKCCKSFGKWEVPTPKCCKDSWNGSFSSKMLQIERTTGRKAGPKKTPKRKKYISKTIPDPYFNWGLYDNSMNWEQAHIYWICLCLGWLKGKMKLTHQLLKMAIQFVDLPWFSYSKCWFSIAMQEITLWGYQMLGFSKDMYQPFKKPMLGISQFFWE